MTPDNLSPETFDFINNFILTKSIFLTGLAVSFLVFLELIFSPLVQKQLTKLHEFGHKLSLKYITKKLNKQVDKSEIITDIEKDRGIFYSGMTYHPIYEDLKGPDMYKYIRLSAISGFLITTVLYLVISIIIICCSIYFDVHAIRYFLIHIIFLFLTDLILFFKSSDFKFFKYPDTFDYEFLKKYHVDKNELTLQIKEIEQKLSTLKKNRNEIMAERIEISKKHRVLSNELSYRLKNQDIDKK